MIIKPEIHENYPEAEIHVCNHEMNDKVRGIMSELHALFDVSINGTDEKGSRFILNPAEVYAFFAEGSRVIALEKERRYVVAKKLYELEEELSKQCFVRISRSEIINYRLIQSLDLSMTGTIKVVMKNGYETFASRRNVAKLKELLVKEKRYE